MREPSFAGILALQVGGAILLLCVILFWKGQWDTARYIGLAMAAPAVVLLLVARYQLGKSFAVSAQARVLVTHGLYAKIRNPIYVFSALLISGFAIAMHVPQFLLVLLVIIPVQIIRARREARVLEEKFGDEYRAYRAQTWF